MIGVVESGTASCCLDLNGGIQVAAKTGTAELGGPANPDLSHAWIVAFAPADAPAVCGVGRAHQRAVDRRLSPQPAAASPARSPKGMLDFLLTGAGATMTGAFRDRLVTTARHDRVMAAHGAGDRQSITCVSPRSRGTTHPPVDSEIRDTSVTNNGEATVINDRYEVHKRIGRGGMADVFSARDLLLDRQVAIKVLFPEFAIDANFVERFRREAQSAANLVAPQHRQRVRLGQVRRHLLHRDGRGAGTHARRHPHDQQAAHVQAGRRDRQRGRRRARLRPRGRRRPPRHQAGQHPDRLERPGEGRRLRHRPSDERRRPSPTSRRSAR